MAMPTFIFIAVLLVVLAQNAHTYLQMERELTCRNQCMGSALVTHTGDFEQFVGKRGRANAERTQSDMMEGQREEMKKKAGRL
jgi:hypothetical protein